MEHLLHFFKRLQTYSGKVLYLNLLGMVGISLLQGMEIFLVIPMLSITGIVGTSTGVNRVLTIFNVPQEFLKTLGLPLILSIYILLVIGQSLLLRNITVRNVKILQGFNIYLRFKTFSDVLQANWDFFIKKRKSDIINTLTTELGRVNAGMNYSLILLTSMIFSMIQIVVASWLSVKLTVFVLICGLVHVVLARRFVKKSEHLGSLSLELSQSYLAGITDQLNGIKDIKSNIMEESRIIWLRTMHGRIRNEQNEYVKLKVNSELLSSILSALFISLFIYFSVEILHVSPEQLLLIVMLFFRLWPRITGMQASLQQIAANIPAFKALHELENECREAKELIQQYNGEKPLTIKQGIECRNVYFRYNPKEPKYSLENINLKIPANRMTAIVGRSGAWKSTLIDILMGLIQPEGGQVLINGTPLAEDNILPLRRSISYVPQDPFLFNTSIRENLLLIKPDTIEKELWEALAFSASAEFVRGLPNGIDTLIGDRGVRLSGGERQRLVIARAILRKPSILILDEATSALDAENETKIQEVLDRTNGEMTIIVVAHRLSTIRNADQVIVLDRGKVIQAGGFNQLARETRGLFSNLLRNQISVGV